MSGGSTGVQNTIITDEDDKTRLDKWLMRRFPGLSKGEIYKWMRTGQVRLDGKRVKPDSRVLAGQEIRIPPVSWEAYQTFKQEKKVSVEDKQEAVNLIKDLTIYEDDSVLVINKPYGMASQGGSKVKEHIDGLIAHLETDKVKPRLVHRLDKDTTGVLLIAKTRKIARVLGETFKTRQAHKYYWAVVAPTPQMNEGLIEANIAKGQSYGGERVMIDDVDGKFSRSEYWILEKAHRKAAWLCFKPETGRKHQLRVHAEMMDSPIVGDSKYGQDLEVPVELDDLKHANKLHLHARRLIMPHPSGRGVLDVTAPLPPHMEDTFKYFEFNPQLGNTLPDEE
ncbi:MAG: RluA family pseudouridine synthase [Pseudomonadota bacterium]